MARTLGIDFGYAPGKPSLGYIQFDTAVKHNTTVISVVVQAEVSTLRDFANTIVKKTCDQGVALIALDAPVTPSRIATIPRVGRVIEKRFSRGDFCNAKRGPQPSSIRVPKQGWPLYCGAMDLMEALRPLGYRMPLMQGGAVALSGKDVVEVCPKMTQSLLVPRPRVVGRPDKKQSPAFYRQIDNWLFSHLFVQDTPTLINPSGQHQPTWGSDRTGLESSLGSGISLDQSVWGEAARIASACPLTRRHELIGAFVSGLQGAMALAGSSVAVGADGQHEGYYVLPSRWHADWTSVWNKTRRKGDIVSRCPVVSTELTGHRQVAKSE